MKVNTHDYQKNRYTRQNAYVNQLSLFILLNYHTHYYFFFLNDTATTEIYPLSLHDALPISSRGGTCAASPRRWWRAREPSAPLVLGVDPPVLPHRPLHGVVRALAPGHPRAHVREHERRLDLLDRGRERPGVAGERDDVGEILEDLQLGVGADHGHRLPVGVLQERHVVPAAADHGVLPVVGEMDEELLRGLRVLRELPDGVGVRIRDGDALAGEALRLQPDRRVREDRGIGGLPRPAGPDRTVDPAPDAPPGVSGVRRVVPGEA